MWIYPIVPIERSKICLKLGAFLLHYKSFKILYYKLQPSYNFVYNAAMMKINV